MRNLSRGLPLLAVLLLAGGLNALPEPTGESVLFYPEIPGRLTRDRAAQPYRPASQRGKSMEQLFDWMRGNSLREFWRQERRAKLPPAVDIWQGTPEEVVTRLIERDRAGQPGARPEIVLPAERELPESGHLRFEFLVSSCSAPYREEAILRWEPAGAWLVLTSSETPEPGFGMPGRAEAVELAEARRIAAICLLLARARFDACPAAPADPEENAQRFIALSSEYVTVTIRSDDRSLGEQVGHCLPEVELDQPWRAGWTSEFAAYLSRRLMMRLFTRLHERTPVVAAARSQTERKARQREQTVTKVQRILEFSARTPELAMPMQLQQALAAVLECDLPELLPLVGPLASRLPPLFGWEKHVQALEAQIAARELELKKHQLPGLAEAIKKTPMNDEVNLADLRARFPGFVAEPLGQLQKARLELKRASPFYAILPYQIERDWQELRETVAAVQRRIAVGDNVAEMRRWADEDSPWSAWAYRRLKTLDPKSAAALTEARLLDPAREGYRWLIGQWLDDLASLAPERLPAVLARLSTEFQERYRPRYSPADSPAPAAKTVTERVAASVRPRKVGAVTVFVLDPLPAGDFAKALRELEGSQLGAVERGEGMKRLAPHLSAQSDPLRARFARLLPKLTRVDRLDVILLGDLREQRAYLLEQATSSPDDFAPDGSASDDESSGKNFRLHRARWIVSIWDEPDPVTRAALVVALDLNLRFSSSLDDGYRWRLQELFRAALTDRPAGERDLVAAQIAELSGIIIARQMLANFEADWMAVLNSVSR